MADTQVILFILASLVVILTPGQDMVLVLSRGVTQGSRAGMVTAAGISLGLLGHTLLAAFGLGSLLLASELLFTILKYVGAAYLIYLATRLIFSQSTAFELSTSQSMPIRQLFLGGAICNLSNPKITIFYFAFLPQFISRDIQNPTSQLLLLGVGFSALTLLIKGPIGYFSGVSSSWFRSRPMVIQWINRTSGLVLIGLGVKLALERRP